MTIHHITNADKRHPQFILAVDAEYYNQAVCVIDGRFGTMYERPINHVPHQAFCTDARSYLTIREREYLDESTSYIQRDLATSWVLNAKGEKKKGDPRYKQLLPYMIARQLQDDGSYLYFPYRRTQKVGESRLAGNGSLGYGGHIDLEDIVSIKSVIDLMATILKSAEREAFEEFKLLPNEGNTKTLMVSHYRDAISFADLFIVDNSNDVGELHLGIVMYFDVPKGWMLKASEDELVALPPMTLLEMSASDTFNPENWTKIYIDHVTNAVIGIDHGGEKVGEVDQSYFLRAVTEYDPAAKAQVLAEVDAAQDAQATAETPYPPLTQTEADKIAQTVTGDPNTTFEQVIDAGYTNNIDWNNSITGSSANAINLDMDELRRTSGVTNAVNKVE